MLRMSLLTVNYLIFIRAFVAIIKLIFINPKNLKS